MIIDQRNFTEQLNQTRSAWPEAFKRWIYMLPTLDNPNLIQTKIQLIPGLEWTNSTKVAGWQLPVTER